MADLNSDLERMQADGRITVHDADEVRRFAEFLADAVPSPPWSKAYAAAIAHRKHYPEHHTPTTARRSRA